MTRVNLVPPRELMDQHLFAEFREIKMVAKALSRSVKSLKRDFGTEWKWYLLERVPKTFVLGTGHVTFFYDKGAFLAWRYKLLREELSLRGYAYNTQVGFDDDGTFEKYQLMGNYVPSEAEIARSRDRIQCRIMAKPTWYKYYGKEMINEAAA